MARTGLEKSLKKHHVFEKSLDFPQKSLNIFESSLNKITFVKKKVFCVKERMKAQQYANFLGCHESVFSCYFNVPGIVYFPLFEVPKEPCLPGERYCNKQTPHHLRIWKVFTSFHSVSSYREKKSLKNLFGSFKSPSKVLDFCPKNSVCTRLSYHHYFR